MRKVLFFFASSLVGSLLAFGVALGAMPVGGLLESCFEVPLVSWEMAGLITALLMLPAGLVTAAVAFAAGGDLRRGLAIGSALHFFLCGAFVAFAGMSGNPSTVNAWFVLVGMASGGAAGIGGGLLRRLSEAPIHLPSVVRRRRAC